MNYRYPLFILVMCVLSCLMACRKQQPDVSKVTELERQALLQPPYVADSLLDIADKQLKDSVSTIIRMAIKARNLGAEEKYDSSNAYIEKVEDFCKKVKPTERIYNVRAYNENTKGVNLIYSSSAMSPLRDSAVRVLNKSIDYARSSKTEKRIPLAYFNISGVYIDRGQYALAAYYCQKAMVAADSLGFPIEQSFFLYSSLGDLYNEMGDYKSTQRIYDEVYPKINKLAPEDRVDMYKRYASLYEVMGDYSKALAYYEKALHGIKSVKIAKQYYYYRTLGSYSSVLIQRGMNLEEAKRNLKEVLAFYYKSGDEDNICSTEVSFLNLAVKQKNPSEAGKWLKKIKEHLDISKLSLDTKLSLFQVLEDYYRWQKSFEQAYWYNKKVQTINDSVRSSRQQQYIANLSLQFQQDTTILRHRLLITRQEAEINTLHWKYVMVVFLGIIVILSFIFYYVYTRRRRALLYHKYVANINHLKMQNIRNCISPHFTFNVLNHEIQLNPESKERYNRLIDLSHLLRKSLDSTGRVTLPLSQELDFINVYTRLLNECGKHFTYTLEMDEEVDADKIIIPAMILQIPVENAVKHGFLKDDPDHFVRILVHKIKGGVEIEILNNGVAYSPFTKADRRTSTGIGMQVIFQSLLLMNAHNREKITFTISDRTSEGKEGTRVRVYIPDHFDYSYFKE